MKRYIILLALLLNLIPYVEKGDWEMGASEVLAQTTGDETGNDCDCGLSPLEDSDNGLRVIVSDDDQDGVYDHIYVSDSNTGYEDSYDFGPEDSGDPCDPSSILSGLVSCGDDDSSTDDSNNNYDSGDPCDWYSSSYDYYTCYGDYPENPPTQNTYDCANVLNGSAYLDDCKECVGGSTNKQPCSCEGEKCTVCGGLLQSSVSLRSATTTPTTACQLCECPQKVDCAGVKGGVAFTDDSCPSYNNCNEPCNCRGGTSGNIPCRIPKAKCDETQTTNSANATSVFIIDKMQEAFNYIKTNAATTANEIGATMDRTSTGYTYNTNSASSGPSYISLYYTTNTVAYIHSHPSTNCFSATDLKTLIEQNDNSSNMRDAYVYTIDGSVYAFHITDDASAWGFLNIMFEEANGVYINEKSKMRDERQAVMDDLGSNGQMYGMANGDFGISQASAWAYMLSKYQAGISILRLDDDGEFKELKTQAMTITNADGTTKTTFRPSECE